MNREGQNISRELTQGHRHGNRRRGLLTALLPTLVERVRPLVDSRARASCQPFGDAELMKPHLTSRLWGWAHFGAFLPDLPEPFRYLNTMTFIGTTGTSAFDNGELAAADVRDNATVLTSTAHDDMYFYRAYDGASDCRFDRDGHHLQWGDNLTWEAEHPVYTITGRYRTFEVDLELRTSEQVSYFVRTPVYDHFSVLAPYVGTITHNGETTEITGLGTIEYGRCVSPQSFARRPLPPRVRLPVDFFTYQVIRIDATTQVLLSNVRVAGGTACLMAHVRSTTRPASVVEKGVTFTVVRYHETHAVDPVGRRMRIPHEIEWYVPGYGHIHGFVDSPLRYGHGLGYVGCYSFTGLWSDEPVSGTGYLEWIDVQHEGSVARGASV